MTMETPICLRLFFLNPLQGDHCTVLGLGAKSVRTPGEPLVARESLKPWFEKMGFNQEKWWLFFWWVHWEKYGWHWMVIEWWLNGDWMVYTSSSGYHLQPLMVYWRFYVGAIALGDLVMLPVMVKSSNRIIGINMAMAWLGTSLWRWFSWLSSSNT